MQTDETEPKRSGTRVLVVDDEPAVAELLKRLLTKDGYAVHLASDGDTALQALAEHKPHVVLLDVNMPGMTGIEVCRRIKHDAATRLTPVVMVTGMAQRDRRIES